MQRRTFLKTVAGVSLASSALSVRASGGEQRGAMPKLIPPPQPACLNLCLQWWHIPAKDMNGKLDYLESHGYRSVEIPSGSWLLKEGEKFKKALKGRKLKVATACGPSDFSYVEEKRRNREVEKFLPQLEVLGMLNAVGLILCPMRKKPGLGLKELRDDFVNNTGRRLAEKAAQCGTHIVLEPLRRNETPFLRQVADGAMIARDIGKGAKVMGDFWHMAREETSFMGALISGGPLLAHIHIASLKRRLVPGVDGEADNYIDGFRGLKLIGYQGAVSFEGGIPKGGNRIQLLDNMVKLLHEQWEKA